jgi:hypothetical protein
MNKDDAYELARKVLGDEKNQKTGGWHLREFQGGWLVVREDAKGMMGAASFVIERESGQVLTLPSSVPPQLITQEWERARQRAHIVSLPPVNTD